jgi:hypothetical protein
MSLNLAMGPNPQAAFGVSVMKKKENAAGSEQKRHCNAINRQYIDGKIRWDFDINDVNHQQKGFSLPEDYLPSVRFEFKGKSSGDRPAPPESMDIAITSYWKLISSSDLKSHWIQIRKILDSFRPTASGDTQSILSYSNLLQIVNLNIIESKLSKPAFHKAKVEFKPRTDASVPQSHHVDINKAPEDAVCVTPSVIASADDKRTKFNLRLLDNSIPRFPTILENSNSTSE